MIGNSAPAKETIAHIGVARTWRIPPSQAQGTRQMQCSESHAPAQLAQDSARFYSMPKLPKNSMFAIFHPPAYSISYYNASVRTSIEEWPAGISADYVRIVEQMVASGPNLGLPYTRPFCDGLFEIRAKSEKGIGRAFFCSMIRRRIVILHGFIKKTQQTPKKELELARKRLQEVLNEQESRSSRRLQARGIQPQGLRGKKAKN